ncbi:methyltransferase domain-containing protein [Streptomyces sp. Pv4-95]|uniref:methyltransferase domain-containing protein n=1 Tax=Streptomyces sp. Pv4-95 TaxID=3049543 RepID=UPI0038915808
MTPAAPADPLFTGLPERLRVLHRQGDATDLPAGATVLATGGRSPAQAFRIGGSAWGLQLHLEADGAGVYEAPVDACAALPEDAAMARGEAATVPDLVESFPGQVASATDLVEAAPAEPPVLDAYCDGVFGRFAALVADRAARTANNTFFTPRAATWEERFAADGPRYTAAVARMGLRPGQRALDVGCGTGRALPGLRAEVGARGVVLGVDLTPAMLTATAKEGRTGIARLLLADACRLPLCDGAVDGIFSAGLVDHLPDPAAGLGEWARVTAPDGVLLLFHPSGRAERAARHGRPLDPADPLAEENLRPALHAAGWSLTCYEDAPRHFLARAVRGERTG